MSLLLLTIVVLASLLIIASGIWVGVALVRFLSLPRRSGSPAQVPQEGRQTQHT